MGGKEYTKSYNGNDDAERRGWKLQPICPGCCCDLESVKWLYLHVKVMPGCID